MRKTCPLYKDTCKEDDCMLWEEQCLIAAYLSSKVSGKKAQKNREDRRNKEKDNVPLLIEDLQEWARENGLKEVAIDDVAAFLLQKGNGFQSLKKRVTLP